jgi:protocatechuate 3,4-dioxygenase alpha subunit
MTAHVFTRLYFADEAEANARDAVLALVAEARRPTLIAAREETSDGPVYRLDIVLQGEGETVFFDA